MPPGIGSRCLVPVASEKSSGKLTGVAALHLTVSS